jgi:acetylornithine deacetylase/succinyl-diaminopimelate desuccinylase-like protein
MRFILTIVLNLMLFSLFGQALEKQGIDQLADKYLVEGVTTLRDFLSLPNYGSIPAHIDQNLKWCEKELRSLDFETSVFLSQGVSHLFGERIFDKDAPTVLFYLQIDGQPVDSAKWSQASPFLPVLKKCEQGECQEIDWRALEQNPDPDWKIFARSAADSKGPSVAFLQSLKILQQEKITPAFNMKVILDFQEELGSPTLPKLVETYRESLAADVILIMDGTRPPGNMPTLTFGARGIATLKLTVFGPRSDMHSGQYGNYVPNPVFTLSHLLASMKDEDGRVLIPGFYEGISLSQAQKELINQVLEDRTEMLETIGIAQPERVGETYQEALQYPTFNVRGMQAGWVDEEVRTIIPSKAVAEIDMRLVTETPAERQIQLVKNHIQAQGFTILDDQPTDEQRKNFPKLIRIESRIGSKPFKTSLDSPIGVWLGLAMDRALGKGAYINMQATGGSQPIEPFISTLGIPAVSIRISNPDSNIHAPNENLRIGNFHEGLKMCLGILTQQYE